MSPLHLQMQRLDLQTALFGCNGFIVVLWQRYCEQWWWCLPPSATAWAWFGWNGFFVKHETGTWLRIEGIFLPGPVQIYSVSGLVSGDIWLSLWFVNPSLKMVGLKSSFWPIPGILILRFTWTAISLLIKAVLFLVFLWDSASLALKWDFDSWIQEQ